MAAVWTLDGRDWRLAHGLSAEEMRKRAKEQQKEGYQPIDVTGYLEGSAEHYAAVWVKLPASASLAQMAVGLEYRELEARAETLRKEGYRQATYCTFAGATGEARYATIWTSAPGKTAPASNSMLDQSFVGIEPEYSGDNHVGVLQVEVQVSRATSTKDQLAQQLKVAEEEVHLRPNDADARLRRGRAYLHLGELEKAAKDLSWLIEKPRHEADAYRYRAIAHACQGKAQQAKADRARFLQLTADPGRRAYLDAVVSAYLGEDAEGMQRLEAAVALNAGQADFLCDAACAFSVASRVVARNEMTRAKLLAARALALLKDAVANGSSKFSDMQSNPDLDPIRLEAGFVALLQQGKVDRRYAAVWHADPLRTSTEIHGLDPAEHLNRCRELRQEGWRPVSISVAEVRAGEALVTASVWRRPVIANEDKERLAKRQANSAVALLKMNQAEKVWPLLKHSPDSRLRSYLVHRLSPMGADPKALVQRLDEEQEVSIRRALLLSLGTFGPDQLPSAERELLIPRILQRYRADPDPGVHGAAEWLLRQWKQGEKLKGMDQELATGKIEERFGWYVNRQGQTMVIIRAPPEFLMGSPGTEADRVAGAEGRPEAQHRKRIGHSYAIAAKEVTVAEFLRFRKDHKHTEQHAPTPDSPVNDVTWYDAAEYCNWLSEREGIPRDQWCYEKNSRGEFAEGMRLKPGYLKSVGYRLPSEAEWEYACRARTVTSRFYGETEELLSQYAWYMQNSQGRRMQAAGSLKPNDLGLFDMLGNALEWCQEVLDGYSTEAGGKASLDVEDQSYVADRDARVARGGAFDGVPMGVRAADRSGYVPAYSNLDVGFRPARSLP